MGDASGYWIVCLAFRRAVALVYLIGFAAAVNQFIPLLGERGLLPVPLFARRVPFWQSPSLFLLAPKDRVFLTGAWAGVPQQALEADDGVGAGLGARAGGAPA